MSKIVIDYNDPLSIEVGKQKYVKEFTDAGMDKNEAIEKVDTLVNKQIDQAKLDEKKPQLSWNDIDEKIAEAMDEKLKGLSPTDKKHMIFDENTEALNKDSNISKEERTQNFIKAMVAMKRGNPLDGRELLASAHHGKSLDEVKEKALAPMSEGTDADGGYLVPDDLRAEIYAVIEKRGLTRQLGSVIQVTTDTVKLNKRNAVLAASLTAEAAAVADDKATFAQVVHTIKKYGLVVAASNELIADNISLLPQELARQAGEAFAKWEDDQFFNSLSGLDSTSFSGVFNAPTENVMGSGDTTFADLAYGDILDCIGGATDAEADGAYWMMNRAVWYANVLALVNSQNYPIGQEGANGKTLMGYPVITSDSIIGTTGTEVEFIAFGNPKLISVAERSGISVKFAEEGTVDGASLLETDQVAWRFLKRISIENMFPASFHAIKTAAS